MNLAVLAEPLTEVLTQKNTDDGKDGWMSHGNNDPFRLGFLTAIGDAERGFVGGLLVTNRFGRPLEFQCTAPVKPNRAQQILYGPTLRPFVLSELIGRTLVEKVGAKPHLVLVESLDLLDLRQHVPMAVGCVIVDPPADIKVVRVCGVWLATLDDFENDAAVIEANAKHIPSDANLREPFERVREALQETIRMGAAKSA